MKQAQVLIEKIKMLENGCKKSNSSSLKKDYSKAIKRYKRELREYCFYKNLNYNELTKGL